MKRMVSLLFIILVGLASAISTQAQTITIGSFDSSRSRLPFTGTNPRVGGYFRLRADLLNPANFGPAGRVPCSVTIAPPTSVITDEYLADKTIFFTSVFRGTLTADEAISINNFVRRGGCVIVDADAVADEQTAANSLLDAIGAGSTITSGPICNSSSTAGTTAAYEFDPIINGPFGGIRSKLFSTSSTAALILDSQAVSLVTCPDGIARAYYPAGRFFPCSGLVMLGGDPSALDVFTNGNSTNEILYLNAIARCCNASPSIPTEICLQDETTGDFLRFNTRTGFFTFTKCGSGPPRTGTGRVSVSGTTLDFHFNAPISTVGPNLDISARVDLCQRSGEATVKLITVSVLRIDVRIISIIHDSDTTNNTCVCP